ncbi:MAG: hypothetical protein ACLQUY_11455 [Ktedonobacterales bacterium]
MEPEEMDLVELVEKVSVDPSWCINPVETVTELDVGARGMVVHRREGTPTLCDVEFLDPTTNQVRFLATLHGALLRVVGRDMLDVE